MSATRASAVVAQICVSVDSETERLRPDDQLIGAFVADRDARAFALLVRRHGPMVLSVCRRITGHVHDAEDAFQAVFLTLARRAGEVARPEAVGNWLYGVAVRVARQARAVAARRRTRETPTDPLPDTGRPAPEPLPADIRALLDEELVRLPDKYRTLLVLCDLGGESQTALAQRLGIPVGTVYSRLATARSLLGERLKKRGVAPPAGGTFALGGVVVSPELARATTALATSGPISRAVAGLANGALRIMFLRKLTAIGTVLLAVLGAAWGAFGGVADSPAPNPLPIPLARVSKAGDEKAVPLTKPVSPGTLLLVGAEGELVALTPDGKEKSTMNVPEGTISSSRARLSPDGTRAAFVVMGSSSPLGTSNTDEPWTYQVVIRKLGATEAKVLDCPSFGALALSWAPDGKRLAVARFDREQQNENLLLDPETGKTEPLELPGGVRVLDWSSDGKTFLVVYKRNATQRLGLAERGAKAPRELTELKAPFSYFTAARFSPDAKRVLFTDADPEEKAAFKRRMSGKPYLLDMATGKREPLGGYPENARCVSVAWSPDGKRVAYTWMQLHPHLLEKDSLTYEDQRTETESVLILCDLSGENRRAVSSNKTDSISVPSLSSIDWR